MKREGDMNKTDGNIHPRLLHKNKSYGEFKLCPFCRGEPYFSISFYDWYDKEDNCTISADEYPIGECAGYRLTICCPNCTISMRAPMGNPYKLTPEEMLTEDFIKKALAATSLLFRWNVRDGVYPKMEVINTTDSPDATV
jgi:hypothetical protein